MPDLPAIAMMPSPPNAFGMKAYILRGAANETAGPCSEPSTSDGFAAKPAESGSIEMIETIETMDSRSIHPYVFFKRFFG